MQLENPLIDFNLSFDLDFTLKQHLMIEISKHYVRVKYPETLFSSNNTVSYGVVFSI